MIFSADILVTCNVCISCFKTGDSPHENSGRFNTKTFLILKQFISDKEAEKKGVIF